MEAVSGTEGVVETSSLVASPIRVWVLSKHGWLADGKIFTPFSIQGIHLQRWVHFPLPTMLVYQRVDLGAQFLGGGFEYSLFSPLGEMIQFDEHIFQMG